MATVTFKGETYACLWQIYPAAPSQPALLLIDKFGQLGLTASVCLPEHTLPSGFIFIKTWSENEGLLEALVAQGVVEDLQLPVPTGYVDAALCRVLVGPYA